MGVEQVLARSAGHLGHITVNPRRGGRGTLSSGSGMGTSRSERLGLLYVARQRDEVQGPAPGLDNLPVDALSRHSPDRLNTSNDCPKRARLYRGSWLIVK